MIDIVKNSQRFDVYYKILMSLIQKEDEKSIRYINIDIKRIYEEVEKDGYITENFEVEEFIQSELIDIVIYLSDKLYIDYPHNKVKVNTRLLDNLDNIVISNSTKKYRITIDLLTGLSVHNDDVTSIDITWCIIPTIVNKDLFCEIEKSEATLSTYKISSDLYMGKYREFFNGKPNRYVHISLGKLSGVNILFLREALLDYIKISLHQSFTFSLYSNYNLLLKFSEIVDFIFSKIYNYNFEIFDNLHIFLNIYAYDVQIEHCDNNSILYDVRVVEFESSKPNLSFVDKIDNLHDPQSDYYKKNALDLTYDLKYYIESIYSKEYKCESNMITLKEYLTMDSLPSESNFDTRDIRNRINVSIMDGIYKFIENNTFVLKFNTKYTNTITYDYIIYKLKSMFENINYEIKIDEDSIKYTLKHNQGDFDIFIASKSDEEILHIFGSSYDDLVMHFEDDLNVEYVIDITFVLFEIIFNDYKYNTSESSDIVDTPDLQIIEHPGGIMQDIMEKNTKFMKRAAGIELGNVAISQVKKRMLPMFPNPIKEKLNNGIGDIIITNLIGFAIEHFETENERVNFVYNKMLEASMLNFLNDFNINEFIDSIVESKEVEGAMKEIEK